MFLTFLALSLALASASCTAAVSAIFSCTRRCMTTFKDAELVALDSTAMSPTCRARRDMSFMALTVLVNSTYVSNCKDNN